MRKLHSLFLLFCILGVSQVWADETFKFGFINLERFYRDSKTVKSVQKKIDQDFSERLRRLKTMEKQALKIEGQLKKSNLGADERLRLEREYSELHSNYMAATEEYVRDQELRRNEEFAAIQARAIRLIKEIAEKEGYDLILQDAVYIKPKYDITDKLIQTLDN